MGTYIDGLSCLECCWKTDHHPCNTGRYLSVRAAFAGGLTGIAVQFLTYNRLGVGAVCGAGAHPYVIFGTGENNMYVDVWGARSAGLWASSVIINLYARNASGSVQNLDVSTIEGALPSGPGENVCTSTTIPAPRGTSQAALCTDPLFKTITVTDTGIVTIT